VACSFGWSGLGGRDERDWRDGVSWSGLSRLFGLSCWPDRQIHQANHRNQKDQRDQLNQMNELSAMAGGSYTYSAGGASQVRSQG